jgi:competence protein ComEC
LRAPRGFANPHAFDYERWLFREKIGATGYAVSAERSVQQPMTGTLSRLRNHLLSRIHGLLPDDDARAVLLAITIGARQDVTRTQWDRYARSGTSHLMAISGLHVGLAAAGLYLVFRVLGAPLACGRNVRDPAVVAAALGATGYALISGLAVPAQRALLMVIIVTIAALLRRRQRFANVLALACLAILIAEPMATLAPGFQLSFFAVALLLWSLRQTRDSRHGQNTPGLARLVSAPGRLGSLQLTLLLGLIPVTVLEFGRIAWLAPFVNLVALPVFNFCTVPLALAGIALDGPFHVAGDALLHLSHQSIWPVLWIVERAAELPYADLQIVPLQGAMLAVLWCAALWALLPPHFPGRWIAWIAAMAVVLHRPERPPEDCMDVHVLDVGQGQAVVVQTRSHLAVVDTGPAFRSGSNTAALVLVPFIRSLGVSRVDTLLVSHADLDHAGGVATLLQHFPVDELLSGELLSVPGEWPGRPNRCETGQRWDWDGIEFRILHPGRDDAYTGNDASCVLEISAGEYRVLLAGDVESRVERQLLGRELLRTSQLVTVPHHGSRTSSSQAFVNALHARTAVVSAGFGNRWGFPKTEVVRRWQDSGAQVLTTATSGAVSQRICRTGGPAPAIEQRRVFRRYWHAPA